ncbi:amino acid oxidase [Rhizobium anhuiense]|uniref:NAD(P)/FAD-dependent oxidoreductase n=1 Tax=Rhizobium anhuiense TaxID=1184720 RepID=UPI000BE851DF|nr:FAD-binding oxidoreductase [Rhizobium anhuiense]PDS59985.1 amino acid oxidase [Rhizobium anhuiense]
MFNGERPFVSGREPKIEDCMWSATGGPKPDYVRLSSRETCDVLVIGGGFNGVTAGLYCAEKGAKALLVEAQDIGSGASGRNAGQVNPGQFLSPEAIQKALGPDYGPRFLKDLGNAPNLVRDMISKHGIECFADERPIVRCATTAAKTRDLEKQTSDWQALGANVEMVYGSTLEEMNGSTRYKAALIDYRGFTLQPLAYVRGLARVAVSKGLRIAVGSKVTSLEFENGRWKAKTGSTTIIADKVILSTNAYSDDLVPGFKEEIMPLGAFGIATADPLPQEWRERILPHYIAMWDTHKIPLWFRYDPEGRLHVGSIGFLPLHAEGDRWVTRAMKFVFPSAPQFKWGYRWSGTIGQTVDRLPHLVEPRPGILATIGCNGRGIAPNTYFGTMLAKMALGETVETPLPVRTPTKYPLRQMALEAYDVGIRVYRNSLLFR